MNYFAPRAPYSVRQGVIYLLHFERPFWHARHYLGWASDLEQRLADHASGNGAKLLRAVKAADIGWRLARTWPGDRNFERSLKKRKKSSSFCPCCQGTALDLVPAAAHAKRKAG